MDSSITIAILALCGTFASVGGGILVALITTNKQARGTAQNAVELALRERLAFRDDQIDELKQDVAEERSAKERIQEAFRLQSEELAECKRDLAWERRKREAEGNTDRRSRPVVEDAEGP